MYVIERDFYFCAAHRLPKHTGKCKNLHGHTWKVTVRVKGAKINKSTGMLIDFSDLKKAAGPFITRYDHTYLNDRGFESPTAENIARMIYSQLRRLTNLNVHSVTVEESRDCRVTYTEEVL